MTRSERVNELSDEEFDLIRGLGIKIDGVSKEDLLSITKILREHLGWEHRGDSNEFPADELSELRNRLSEIQNKLCTLGCFESYPAYKNGFFDKPTRVAIKSFLERVKKNSNPSVASDQIEDMIKNCFCDDKVQFLLSQEPPFTFDELLRDEWHSIRNGRSEVNQPLGVTSKDGSSISIAHEARLMGLAFSGGGIRSATFNLGALQALARHKLLHRFDYLSTVSGGGYIGGWLHAWVHRESGQDDEEKPGITVVESKLAKSVEQDFRNSLASRKQAGDSEKSWSHHEPHEIHWLRRYSNYLTPQRRLLGADAIAGLATWLRNVLLNQVMLVSLILALFTMPWLFMLLITAISGADGAGVPIQDGVSILAMLGGLCTLAALALGWLAFHDKRACDGVINSYLWLCWIFSRKAKRSMVFRDPRDRDDVLTTLEIARLFFYIGSPLIGAALALLRLNLALNGWPAEQSELNTLLASGWSPYILATATLGVGFFLAALLFNCCPDSHTRGDQQHESPPSRHWWSIWPVVKRHAQRLWTFIKLSLIPPLFGAATFVVLLVLLGKLVWPTDTKDLPEEWVLVTIFAGPIVHGAVLLGGMVLVAFRKWSLKERDREWFSRLTGIILRASLIWILVASIAILGPFVVERLHGYVTAMGGAAWVLTTLAGVFLGRSAATGDGQSRWREFIALVAPYVFLGGLLVTVSWSFWASVVDISDIHHQREIKLKVVQREPYQFEAGLLGQKADPSQSRWEGKVITAQPPSYKLKDYVETDSAPMSWFVLLMTLVISMFITYVLGHIVDINLFSFHRFYANRLARCYLGASNKEREKNKGTDYFTDLNSGDSPALAKLISNTGSSRSSLADPCDGTTPADQNNSAGKEVEGCPPEPVQRPYPIINGALNLTSSRNPAWQERKAASFVFTPAYCGYQISDGSNITSAYQHTKDFLQNAQASLPLATAVAVSGAAASPNAGYHTSGATSALMAVFNVRLGMWFQNPREIKSWRERGPKFSLYYFLKELFSSTDEQDDFVYVSDGGHFDNLGLYELVRRRCRYIVLCDVECDPEFRFEGLANAIRKCKVDLGIVIDIDTRAIVPDPATGLSRSSCAVGRIHYERRDSARARATGYLLYLKATLTGNEPLDIKHYHAEHKSFPHESTGDQWYSESQFESYRALGYSVMNNALAAAMQDEERERNRRNAFFQGIQRNIQENPQRLDREVLFNRLAEHWYASTSSDQLRQTHEETLQQLMRKLGEDKELGFLVGQFNPEWPNLARSFLFPWAPFRDACAATHQELRAGFYYCNQLIHFMETVYEECSLEQEYSHPENRRWINLFRHWSWSDMFRATWAVSASSYGARFQQFCGRHLKLSLGRIQLMPRIPLNEDIKKSTQFTDEELRQLECLHTHYIKRVDKNLGPKWHKATTAVVPLWLRLTPTDEFNGSAFEFPVGFAVVDGRPRRVDEDENEENRIGVQLRYFRIRDHLRRMGLGRRGLEELWRSNSSIQAKVPRDINQLIDEADAARLGRLWHSVLAAVPGQEMRCAREKFDCLSWWLREGMGGIRICSLAKQVYKYCREVLRDQADNEQALRTKSNALALSAFYIIEACGENIENDPIKQKRKVRKQVNRINKACQNLNTIIEKNRYADLAYYNRAALRARYNAVVDVGISLQSDILEKTRTTTEDDLKEALRLNFTLAGLADNDPDFKKIKGHHWFKQLIREPNCN